MNKILIVGIIVCLLGFVGYVLNIVKLTKCDFASPYKCEIVHGIGLFPAVGPIAGWINVGK